MRDLNLTSKKRLEHIIKAISDIEGFTNEYSKESFINDVVLINAVLFQFTIIGEAINHVDNTLLDKYPYSWYKARAFRNFIVHEYHAIEFGIVWEAVKKDLPELKKIIQSILVKELFE